MERGCYAGRGQGVEIVALEGYAHVAVVAAVAAAAVLPGSADYFPLTSVDFALEDY